MNKTCINENVECVTYPVIVGVCVSERVRALRYRLTRVRVIVRTFVATH
jgi:hypothetical protein